ncbi:sulfotransferase family protein [Pseudomonas vranovensis]|uniref:sulfotransferase family protein n=1 Tax=Pseudomonas vranovensis TaxID=321661 RepID=UPI003D975DE5
MSDNKQGKLSVHPYIGGSASNLIRNVIKHGGVSRDKLATFTLTLCGTALTLPLRLVETLRFNKAIERSRLQEDPIFILGHWRSGTTHLHNVISQDKRLGYLTTLQAIFPTCAVILSRHKLLKRMVASLLPAQRMMDNMKIGVDLPQEEEFSLSCLMTTSHHCNHFPRTIRESFDKYVLFQTSPDEVANWEKVYQQVIKKASFLANGKRLVLKNPYNTARIPMLLKLYPNAKFIHISRNPYNIYVSALHDFVKEAEEMALQEFTNEDFSELCYSLYGKIMNAYWDARDLVPPGNLVEVSYEDFDEDPLNEVKRIYQTLDLPLEPAVLKDIEAYLASIAGYKKNKYTYSEQQARAIEANWGFALEKMKYSLPPDIVVDNSRDWSCDMNY